MFAHDNEDDVKRLLQTAYDAPPPDEKFAEDLLDKMKRELRETRGTGQAQAPQKVARPLPAVWRWVAVAALALAAVGLTVLALHEWAKPPAPQTPGSEPQVQGTPEEVGRQPPPAAGQSGEKLVPLAIKMPRQLFGGGTPKNILPRPTLEKYATVRPPFLAPEGTTNVALGKPVTASDKDPIIGDTRRVTDGDKEGTDGSFVEYGPGLQWVQIDLKEPCRLYAIVVWHYHAEARVYHDLVVQVSDDPDFIQGVRTVFNNDFDNSSGLGLGWDLEYIESSLGKLIDAKGARARYVRLYSKGNTSNDQNHCIEVEVYGKPASAR